MYLIVTYKNDILIKEQYVYNILNAIQLAWNNKSNTRIFDPDNIEVKF